MSWRARIDAQLGTLALNVDLHGERGPVALVGPNGSGKTTLLRMIAGAHCPARGRIEVDGTPLFDSERALSLPPHARRIGYVPQGYGLFPHLRAIDNVAFGLSTGPNKRPRKARRYAARQMLEDLGCAPLAERFPAELSGGEQQRVALARALVLEPRLLLLDEPLAALDASTRRDVRQFLAARLEAWQRPCLVVTHDVRDVLALKATVCVLQEGQIVQRGDVTALRARPATDFVAELVQ